MIEIVLLNGETAYTELTPEEVRHYLQKGVSTNSFIGYLDADKSTKILIHVSSILYVKL